jgi:1,6-anhydro-N-acetylmuramate kinase
MTCGDTQTTGWLDASRAAQLCTGIWAVNHAAAMDADDTCTIGRHIRRVRHARDKSLRVIAELAGMNKSTQHGVTTAAVARSTSARRPDWPDRSRV